MTYPLNTFSKETQKEIETLIEAERNKIKQEFINGERCLGCGKKTDTALADWCGSCLEEN